MYKRNLYKLITVLLFTYCEKYIKIELCEFLGGQSTVVDLSKRGRKRHDTATVNEK